MEWNITINCKRCGRQSSKYFKAKFGQKTVNVGCKECGLHTEVDLRDHTITVGDLKIIVWYPYYGS